MYRLAVDREWRRRRVAQALVEVGENRLRELGISRVSALIAHEDLDAQALWEATGYRRDPLVGRFVHNL